MTPHLVGLDLPALRSDAQGIGTRRARRSAAVQRALGQWELDDAITVVLFAGLGGACQGLEEAGLPVAVAVNHDEVAIAAHAAMHPHTKHIRGDIFDVDPMSATGGRPVKVLWASPDCRDHSVAKGGAPRSPRVRSMPWQVCRWMGKAAPLVVFIENVREIRGWGPLIAKRCTKTGRVVKLDGTVAEPGVRVPVREQMLVRDPRHAGRSYRALIRHMRGLGYSVEALDLCCADFGVPTSRRRWFAVARRDGAPIGWMPGTHAPADQAPALGRLPWVPAWTIVDWSIPMQSIFGRARPLAVATERRIAAGLRRYVLESAAPFLMPITHHGAPRVHGLDEPLRTLTTAHHGEIALVAPSLTVFNENCRGVDLRDPITTLTAGAPRFGLVAAWLVKHYTGATGGPASEPVATLTARPTQHYVAAAYLAKLRGTSSATDVEAPIPTLSAGGTHVAAVAAFLTKYYGTAEGQAADEPLHALTSKARFGVVTVDIAGEPHAISDIGMRMLQPHEMAAAHELTLPKQITINGIARPLTKTEATRLIGNSVPKRMARLLAEANAVHALQSPQKARAAA